MEVNVMPVEVAGELMKTATSFSTVFFYAVVL